MAGSVLSQAIGVRQPCVLMQSAADASSRAAVAASAAAAAVAVTKAAAARAATKAAHATRVAAGGKRRKKGSATNGFASQQRPSSSNGANGNGASSGKSGNSKDGDKSFDGAEDQKALTDIEEQLLSGQQTRVHLKARWEKTKDKKRLCLSASIECEAKHHTGLPSVQRDSCANHCDVAQLQEAVTYLSLCLNLCLLDDMSKPSART